MGSEFVVVMESEEFGKEQFFYDSEGEAAMGFRRLKESCYRHYESDGVVRQLTLMTVHDEWACDDDDED